MQDEWFKSWFDSPYYALLYRHRDYKDAQLFIDNLVAYLKPDPLARVLDVACGSGRHAIYLHKLGFDVTGVDLSRAKVEIARTHESEHLHFEVGDMRELAFDEPFDLVLNLFTSMGYFSDLSENQQVFNCMRRCLKPNGHLVVDFLNPRHVQRHLVPFEKHEIEGIQFEIKRSIHDGLVEKRIRVTDGNKILAFKEAVQLLGLRDFERMLKRENFRITQLWGNYLGAPYDEEDSPRLILFAQPA